MPDDNFNVSFYKTVQVQFFRSWYSILGQTPI